MIVAVNPTAAQRWRRALFVVYAIALATGTHLPDLTTPSLGMDFSDKLVHFAAFLIWTVLLCWTGWIKGPRHGRRLLLIATTAGAYALIDELTQAFPALHRSVSVGDLAANFLGVATGVAGLAVIDLLRGRGAPKKIC